MTGTSRIRRGLTWGAAACAAVLLTAPRAAEAQLGAGLGFRVPIFEKAVADEDERRALEMRLFFDGARSERLGWRAEFALAQAQFLRADSASQYRVVENAYELGIYGRLAALDGPFAGLHLSLGPLFSHRFMCGGNDGPTATDGEVNCGGAVHSRIGYSLGAGGVWPQERTDMIWEMRYLNNTMGGRGGGMLSISMSLRRRPPMRDDE